MAGVIAPPESCVPVTPRPAAMSSRPSENETDTHDETIEMNKTFVHLQVAHRLPKLNWQTPKYKRSSKKDPLKGSGVRILQSKRHAKRTTVTFLGFCMVRNWDRREHVQFRCPLLLSDHQI